jgi:hypothetical protein
MQPSGFVYRGVLPLLRSLKRLSFKGPRIDSCLGGGVCVRVIISIVLLCFSAIAVIGGIGFLVLDAMDKVESIKNRAPWLTKILERRSALAVLLMICTILLIGDGYELLAKELPEVPAPPTPTFKPPNGPSLTIYQLPQLIKEQCWVRNYNFPLSSTPVWSLATVFCNTTIKPPYSVELDYDQTITTTPFAFPVGSEFSKFLLNVQGTKAVAMFDTHTIIPNEPFSIIANSSTDKFPLVKAVVIRAKGRLFEFHP